jgi:uncharacterized delta-60 repeat protein
MPHNRILKIAIVILGMVSWITLPAAAQSDGSLDATFGSGGVVTTMFARGPAEADAIVLQPDGRIVVGGYSDQEEAPSNATFALARYNADGSLDMDFGVGGKVTTDFLGGQDFMTALVLQPDGKLIAAGNASDGIRFVFGIARYNPDGSLDSSFGVGGKLTQRFSAGSDQASGVAVQSDGKIVVAGTTQSDVNNPLSSDFVLIRYNSDGTPDRTFGSSGIVITDMFGRGDEAGAVAIQPDGRIVVAGTSGRTGGTFLDFALARYLPDGSLDPAFGTEGKVATDFLSIPQQPSSDYARALALQSDGHIVVAGTTSTGGWDFALARYNSDGSLDSNFGNGGKVTTDFSGLSDDQAHNVVIQGENVIVAGESYAPGRGFEFALTRYKNDGSLDQSFGDGGKVLTGLFHIGEHGRAAVVQSDGHLTVAGSGLMPGRGINYVVEVIRYIVAPKPPEIPDFGISLQPGSISLERGHKVTVTVNLNRIHGFAGGVTVSVPDAAALGLKLNQDSAVIDGSSATFKLKAKGRAPRGSHQLSFVAVDGQGRQRTAALAIDIQ